MFYITRPLVSNEQLQIPVTKSMPFIDHILTFMTYRVRKMASDQLILASGDTLLECSYEPEQENGIQDLGLYGYIIDFADLVKPMPMRFVLFWSTSKFYFI